MISLLSWLTKFEIGHDHLSTVIKNCEIINGQLYHALSDVDNVMKQIFYMYLNYR